MGHNYGLYSVESREGSQYRPRPLGEYTVKLNNWKLSFCTAVDLKDSDRYICRFFKM